MNLSEIKRGPKKSKEQKNALYNIEILCKVRNEAIKLYEGYSSMASETKNKAKNKTSGKGIKTLTPKQIVYFKTNSQKNCLFFVSIKRSH